MAQQRIGVIGAGAMGTVFGAGLGERGHVVRFAEISLETVERINTQGVRVEGQQHFVTRTGRAAMPTTQMAAPCEIVFVFVKGMHTQPAITETGAAGFWGPETTVVTLQNGWGNPDRLCAAGVDAAQLVAGISNHSATLAAPGHVQLTHVGPTVLGPWVAGPNAQRRATGVAQLLREVGWDVHVREDIRAEIWKKLVLNSASLPISALTGLPCLGLVECEPTRDLMMAVMHETVAVGRALGFEIDEQERIAFVLDLLRQAGQGKPSMLQDFLARRRSEIDTVTGAIVAKAREVNVPVPVNETLYRLVTGAESAWMNVC